MLRKSGSKDSSMAEISDLRRVLSQVCVVGVENLILLGWGLNLGYPSILINALQNAEHNNNNSTQKAGKDFELTTEEISWIGLINLLSVTFGCVSSGLLMDPIGKRRLMQILNISMLVAWALFYFASDSSQIYIGLCLSGVSGGLLEPLILIYIAETVQLRYRGVLMASGVASVLIGVFLQFICGTIIIIIHWRIVALISATIPILGFIGVFFVPETPYWLCKKNRIEQAHKSLQRLRGWAPFENVKKEFEQIKSSIEKLKSEYQAPASQTRMLSNCLIPYTKRNFIVPFFLIAFGFACGHFSGIFSVHKHANEIFEFYHIAIDEYHAILLLGTVQVSGCLIGVIFIKCFGIRRLVLFSMLSCIICFGTLATYHQWQNSLDGHIEPPLNSTTNTLQSSFEHFEYNFLKAAIVFRDRIDEDALRIYGSKVVDINESTADKLTQLIEVITIASSFTFDNFTQRNSIQISPTNIYLSSDNFLNKYLNTLLMSKPKVLHIFTINEMINKTFANWYSYKNYNSNDLFELLNVTKAIVQTSIPNEIEEQTIFAIVENIIEDTQLLNTSNYNNSKLIDNLNDLSWMLSLFTKSLTSLSVDLPEILARHEISQNPNWLLLFLLLSGSFFSHMGMKLLPWVLIGEVYPMKIRNTAAGISSAMGYLIGYISCELFSNMVHIFTMNGIFWLYSIVTALACIILYFILPETENRTLQEIEDNFKTH